MSQNKSTSSRKPFRQKIIDLEKELDETKEKMMRALADFDNYRKRMEKDMKEVIIREKEKTILPFLEIYENIKMVSNEVCHEGLDMTINLFEKTLDDEGIGEIDAIGKKFDYNLHHAVATKKVKGEENIIIEEIKKGYMMKGKVIRPSYVIVAKGDKNGKGNRN